MKKVVQLIFGDARNVASVGVCLAAAYVTFRWFPDAAGWVLAVGIIAAAAWQAR